MSFLPVDLLAGDILTVGGVAFAMCVLAAIYPALRAAAPGAGADSQPGSVSCPCYSAAAAGLALRLRSFQCRATRQRQAC